MFNSAFDRWRSLNYTYCYMIIIHFLLSPNFFLANNPTFQKNSFRAERGLTSRSSGIWTAQQNRSVLEKNSTTHHPPTQQKIHVFPVYFPQIFEPTKKFSSIFASVFSTIFSFNQLSNIFYNLCVCVSPKIFEPTNIFSSIFFIYNQHVHILVI